MKLASGLATLYFGVGFPVRLRPSLRDRGVLLYKEGGKPGDDGGGRRGRRRSGSGSLGGILPAGVVLVVVAVVVVPVVGVGLPVVDHEGPVGVVVLEVVVVLDQVVAEGGADLKRANLRERTERSSRRTNEKTGILCNIFG
jgi:hypothetical protein